MKPDKHDMLLIWRLIHCGKVMVCRKAMLISNYPNLWDYQRKKLISAFLILNNASLLLHFVKESKTMNLCSDGHEEVCYEARTCPACEAIQAMQNDIDDKDNRIKELNDELNN